MRSVHFLADEHRRELVADARSHRGSTLVATHESGHESAHECPDNVQHLTILSATQRSAAGIPVTGGRAVRRAMAPRLGAWLIDFGTRLGGATVRTS